MPSLISKSLVAVAAIIVLLVRKILSDCVLIPENNRLPLRGKKILSDDMKN